MSLFDRLSSLFGRSRRPSPPDTPLAAPTTQEGLDALFAARREPAIWLRRIAKPVSSSKLGGLPNLPEGVEWPRQGVCGTPLHFLAQIDLAHLPQTPLAPKLPALPRQGVLFFFADMEEEMLWGFDERGTHHDATRVIYAATSGALRQPPANLPLIGHEWGKKDGGYAKTSSVFPEAPIDAHIIDSFDDVDFYFQGVEFGEADRRTLASIEAATGVTAPTLDFAADDRAFPAAWVSPPRWSPDAPKSAEIKRHQMLGAASNVQGAAQAARERGDILLLQLDTDWGLDESFMFCDCGMSQFWISPRDLAAGRFDRAWATTEGG